MQTCITCHIYEIWRSNIYFSVCIDIIQNLELGTWELENISLECSFNLNLWLTFLSGEPWFHRRRSKWVNWDWIWGTVWSRWLANCQRRAVLSIGWVAPFRSSSPVNTSPPPLSAKICPDSLIPAEHEKMSHSSPSCRRQLVLYTFYHHFSLFTGRANIGDSGSCGDVGELASNLGEKEKEEKRLKHKVARFECILSIDLKCQFVALLCPSGLSELVAKCK